MRRSPSAGPEADAPRLPGVAPALASRLAKLGVRRPFDLVLHLPLRYEDETICHPIAQAPRIGDVQVEGVVVEAEVKYRPRPQLVARVADDTGELTVRLLHFYPNQRKQFTPGNRLRLGGELRSGFFGHEMVHPRIRVVSEGTPLPDRLTPVYPTTAGVSQHALRQAVRGALAREDLSDTLPSALLDRLGLPRFADAVRLLHDPPPDVALGSLAERTHPAWQRVKFDELLAQQISMRQHRARRDTTRAHPLPDSGTLTERLRASLPFALTAAQERTLADIRRDLLRHHPMQRLLQGDVGSGKTVVSALAALIAVDNGFQVAVMAPTEILAEQHHASFRAWLEPLGLEVAWLSGSLPARERREALEAVASGEAAVAVGTHALFQTSVTFQRLALAIIDEQHRFGVHQRLALRMKGATGGELPHQLMMSATPIPRTLAMSYYADLDVSVIDELPPGRTPVVTKLVSEGRREAVLDRVRDTCGSGGQAYWVCPLIEESEQLQLATALETHQTLSAVFGGLRVGLVHGRMPPAEKQAVMQAFQRGEVHVLVATTVIEVGVNVPNASLMVIEHAERMGLAQLHQLRGRVGRGAAESACILLYQQPLSETARARLKIIYEHTDGFVIAQKDLELRGPGEMLGARQSGTPMLRFADLARDEALLTLARRTAEDLLGGDEATATRHVERWLGGREALLRV